MHVDSILLSYCAARPIYCQFACFMSLTMSPDHTIVSCSNVFQVLVRVLILHCIHSAMADGPSRIDAVVMDDRV